MDARKVYLDVEVDSASLGRITVKSLDNVFAKKAEVFFSFCIGKGSAKQSLKGARLIKATDDAVEFALNLTEPSGSLLNDRALGDVKPNESTPIYPRRGMVSIANETGNLNELHFFVSLKASSNWDAKRIFVGEVIEGDDVLSELERMKTNQDGVPISSAVIANCGSIGGCDVIKEKVNSISRTTKYEEEKLREASQQSCFPVPTIDNPSAMHEDDEIRQKTRERLDQEKMQKLERGIMESSGDKSSSRRRKMMELLKRQAEARANNQERVVEEHREWSARRKSANTSDDGISTRSERKRQKAGMEASRGKTLTLMGIDESKSYLLDTIESTVDINRKHLKRYENVTSAQEAHHSNQDTLLRSYEKDLKKGMADGCAETTEFVGTELDYGSICNDSHEAKVRLAKSVQPRASSRRYKTRLDEEDVSAINEANEKYNQLISKKLDKYTVEIRQNLERGTAL